MTKFIYDINIFCFTVVLNLDIFCMTIFVYISVGYTGAYKDLVSQRPPGSLVKLSNLISIICQVILVTSFQVGALFYLRSQPW